MDRSRLSKIVPVFVVLLLLITACGDSDDSVSASGSTPTEQSADTTTTATSEPPVTATSQPTATATSEPTDQASAPETDASDEEATSTEEWMEAVRTANPHDGTYYFLTFDEAQGMVDFTLVMPDPMPSSMVFDSATIAPPPAAPPPSGTPMPTGEAAFGQPNMVDLTFQPASGEQQPVIMSESAMSGEMSGGDGPVETVTINGVEVTKQTLERDTNTTLVYMWDMQGLSLYLQAFLKPDLPLTTEDFEALIAGTIP